MKKGQSLFHIEFVKAFAFPKRALPMLALSWNVKKRASLFHVGGERAGKPGSVVGRPFISNACRQAPLARNPNARKGGRIAFLFALAPDGVFQAAPLPTRWCALTAPFQLFSRKSGGVFFSVALIRRVAPPSR